MKREHGCLSCFTRCKVEGCDANHKCMNCGADYIYFVDVRAKEAADKFLSEKPDHMLGNLIVNFDKLERKE